MFRFRSSTSSGSASNPASSPFTSPSKPSQPNLPTSSSAAVSAESIASSTSSSSILSLLQAQSSASSSTSALSPATSLSSLPSESAQLTSEPLPAPEPTKATARVAPASSLSTTTTPRKQQPRPSHAAVSPRRSTILSSPQTSRATTTINGQSSPSPTKPASRRSTIVNNSTDRSSGNVAIMAKKAKVGSGAKSSPFTKAATVASAKEASIPPEKPSAESGDTTTGDADTTLATVVQDEGTPAPATPTKSQSKPAELASIATSSTSTEAKQNVVVCVRMRPTRATSSEAAVWNCDPAKNTIVPTENHPAIAKRTTSSERAGAPTSIATTSNDNDDSDPSSSTYHFQFDKLIVHPQTTDDMYHSHIAPVVKAAVEGYNGTVFAYGQTGSGKTHTMSGSENEPGVIPRAVEQVFSAIKEEQSDREFLLRVSYLEIYNETLKDLLAPLPLAGGDRPASPIKGGSSHAAGQSQSSTLRIIEDQKQNRVLITGLREEIVADPTAVLDLITRGQEERHVGATDWNERSSRSHCVFTLTIESRPLHTTSSSGKEVRISQLNLIDLAGSERAASQAERRKEGAFINKSLLTLGTVIGKLTEPSDSGDAHVPYRDSKLTRILQTSLSGNARIAVICTLSPDTEHANETLSTLKFGKRCKLVVTTAKKGTAMDDKALLQKYRKELDALRAKLEANGPSPNPDNIVVMEKVDPAASLESQQKLDELNQQREAAKKEVEDMQKKRSDLKGQIEHLTRLILTSQSVATSESGNAVAGPSTPARSRPAHAHAGALSRRGPRMSDFAGSLYNSPVSSSVFGSASEETGTLGGVKPFELESELAALRRQLRTQIESRQTLIAAHAAELAARDARAAELLEAIRLNEEELDEAEVAYDKLKEERDEARKIALKEQEKARENKRKWLEEQEANRLLKLVAKARAGDEDKAMQEQIERLREQLKLKEAEVSDVRERLEVQLNEARAEVGREKVERQRMEKEVEEERSAKLILQGELDAATTNAEELREKLASVESNTKDEEEDINAEFQDLVRGKPSQDVEATATLDQRSAELDERERQLEQLRSELEQTRLELASSQPSPTATRELASLRDELSASEEERQVLQVEVAKLRATASGREQDASKLAALDSELMRANGKIAELEKEILAEKAKIAEAHKTVSRPLPVPAVALGQESAGVRSVPTSPIKAFAGSKLRPTTPQCSGAGLNRAGSVKEYRRYQAGGAEPSSPASPSPTAGSRSAFLSQEAFSGGRSATLNSGFASTNRAEKEEIERLNAVINSQRAIMADLEKSVASWKTRMKAQAELIQKLVLQNNPSTQSPPTSDGENEETFSSLSSPRRKVTFNPEEAPNTLPRTTHLSLSQHQSVNEPYYGAHAYNRPPPNLGLGMQPASPHKASYNTWSAAHPSPLPLPNGSESPLKRKPRKTIEMDLKLLKSSPRVESNKNKFDLDALTAGSRMQDTPTKRRGTNASAYYI